MPAGITFTTGQAATIKKMAQTGDLLGAQKAILDKVKGAYGGAAAAAVTPSQRLSVATEELRVKVGNFLLPALTKLENTGSKAFTWATEHTRTVKILGIAIGVLIAATTVEKIIGFAEAARESTIVTKA